MDVQFIGSTEGVTGSMSIVSTTHGKILIDCGMYQGESEDTKNNSRPFPFKAKEIDAVILTHAHLDHSGLIPKLIKDGFRGQIYLTKPTMKLANVIMRDSAKLLENEKNPNYGIYKMEDVVKAASFFKIKKYHEKFELIGLEISLFPAGHILGASSVKIKGEKTIIFSGDLGRFDDLIIEAPELCPEADFLVLESTYGGKNRNGNLEEELIKFLDSVRLKNRIAIVASFAVARGQLLISLLTKYFAENPDNKIRVVIDSPMMQEANKIYGEFSESTRMPDFIKSALLEVEAIDQERKWLSIQKSQGPLIVISSSGMVAGGRIWRYLENWQNDAEAILFLPGYQAKGTAGRLLSEGKREIYTENGVKIHWHGEIMTSDAFSSHADQEELCSWLVNVKKDSCIYLNHGEMEAKELFKKKLNGLGYNNVFIATTDKVISI